MATPPTSPPIPKAALYTFPKSLWGSVVALALEEKGYGPDELEIKHVDTVKGENFSPSYLRINPKGTIPTLVVPLEKTLAAGLEHRFKALTETKVILEFLDKSRSASSRTHTTSTAPAPALRPATIDGNAKGNLIINLLHEEANDPNFLLVSARNDEELAAKASGFQGTYVRQRFAAITKYLAETPTPPEKALEFLRKKSVEVEALVVVYDSTPGQTELREPFYALSKKAWETEQRNVFETLEKNIVGPYALGDQVSLADLHVAAYLSRVVNLSGGDATEAGILGVEKQLGEGFKVGPKVKALWKELIARPSYKKVYADGVH